jgi:thymidine kinase
MNGHNAIIELVVGTMRSNKSHELLRRVEIRRQYAKQDVLLFKPSADTKAAFGVVESRNGHGTSKMEAIEFPSTDPWSILPIIAEHERKVGKRVDAIAIDEGQFAHHLFMVAKRLLESGYDVMISGLELDFRGAPFGDMLNLSWLVHHFSGSRTEQVAYCSCGQVALYPQRLIDGKPAPYDSPVVLAGDGYEPRCAEHFVLPGAPH